MARLGVDIGGTFTDVVLEVGDQRSSTKALTTYARPEDAIVEGLHKVCNASGAAPSELSQIIHGTTLATNALIERRGAKTALITTQGFRDVIEMRTESRFEQYDLNLVLPDPLLPRNRRYVVAERMDANGNVLTPLDLNEVRDLAARLANAGYDSIAIGFLHAYANDAHEIAVREILADAMPGVSISISSEVSPQMREYERFNTTIANAYIKPMMKSYLDRLKGRLASEGADCPVYLMHSGGGLMSLEDAADFPVRLVESGPAGGAVFAAHLAARHGLDRVLSFDMGGTTAKICLIRNQRPKTARVFEVARSYRFKKGSGMPISIPVIDMVEIGAGGGSIATVDRLDQIRVGPESAGSEPGPASYGRGGVHPAVTDADLLLGRLDPARFAGGSIPLSKAAATIAVTNDIASSLSMDPIEAAWGISEVVDENMANAARVHAVENGEDLSDYTMIAFGGGAPLHAARLCEKLGIKTCLVPEGAGVGSAIGFLRAPFSFEANRSVFMRLDQFDGEAARRIFEELEQEGQQFIDTCAPETGSLSEHRIYMRYAGQGWEIPVRLPTDILGDLSPGIIQSRFEEEYAALFDRTVEGTVPEITVWSVNTFTKVPEVSPVDRIEPNGAHPTTNDRELFDPAIGRFVSAQAIERGDLRPGMSAAGPAVLTEDETAIVVPSSRSIESLADGTLRIDRRLEDAE